MISCFIFAAVGIYDESRRAVPREDITRYCGNPSRRVCYAAPSGPAFQFSSPTLYSDVEASSSSLFKLSVNDALEPRLNTFKAPLLAVGDAYVKCYFRHHFREFSDDHKTPKCLGKKAREFTCFQKQFPDKNYEN